MHTKIPSRAGLSLVAVSFLFCASAAPAQAGFQWVSPNASDSAAPAVFAAPVTSAPTAPVRSSSGDWPSPQIIEASPAVAAPATAAPLPPASSSSAPSEEKVVRGFANKVPLSVALRQVLPQEYGFSVAQDVGLGTEVSWQGGAPWRSVLRDMLAPAGLAAKEQGMIVQVVKDGKASALSEKEPLLRPMDDRPVSLAPASLSGGNVAVAPPAPARAAVAAPLPARSVAPTMGYLTPPAEAMPVTPLASATPISSSGGAGGRPDLYDAWTANKGDSLHKVLEDWCRRAGVELSWQAEYDYPLQASVLLNGSFEDAVRGLLAGFQEAKPQPVGQLYSNRTAGQSVLVVQVRGNNYND